MKMYLRRYTGPALTKALPRQDGEEMLRAAMAVERSTAARRTEDPFADLGVSFKEVGLGPEPPAPRHNIGVCSSSQFRGVAQN